jgi:hypothetical protein
MFVACVEAPSSSETDTHASGDAGNVAPDGGHGGDAGPPSCQQGFQRDGNTCVDIDECLANNGGCSTNAQCTNTVGSRTCNCNQGYTGNGIQCDDVNECDSIGCGANTECENTAGSYSCRCARGFRDDGAGCVDIDECQEQPDRCLAQGPQVCVNRIGWYECLCAPGYKYLGGKCQDINECWETTAPCPANSTCDNLIGSYTCQCNRGYAQEGAACVEINCLVNNGGCHPDATCFKYNLERTCTCKKGFTGDGFSCQDIDECATMNGGCDSRATCTNTHGGRICACQPPYIGAGTACSLPVTDFAMSQSSACAVQNDFALRCWGQNSHGEIGIGTKSNSEPVTQVSPDKVWSSIDAGPLSWDLYAQQLDGSLWTWGYTAGPTPTTVPSMAGMSEISSRSSTVCGIQSNGGLKCGKTTIAGTDWSTVSVGGATCALKKDSSLWCWGDNSKGEVGDGTTTSRSNPVNVLPGTTWLMVRAGDHNTCGIQANGTLWCWGGNNEGQVGDGTRTARTSPVQVGTATNWASVAAPMLHTCATQTNGALWCWGEQNGGSLGIGCTPVGVYPSPSQAGTTADWARVEVNLSTTCGLKFDGTLWCWGANIYRETNPSSFAYQTCEPTMVRL